MFVQTGNTARASSFGPKPLFMSRPLSSPLSNPTPSRAARRRVWMRWLGWTGGVLGTALIGSWAWRDDDIAPAQREELPSYTMESPSFTVRKNGARLWQFDAAQIEPSPDGTQTFARKLKNGILFRADKPVLHLSAARVRLENATNNVEASGGVKASGPNRFAVESKVVKWNYARKMLSCPEPVNAMLRDFRFKAPRLNYNWESGELGCDSPVELSAPGLQVRAPRFKASTKTHVLDLGGGAQLSFDPRTARPQKWRDVLSLP